MNPLLRLAPFAGAVLHAAAGIAVVFASERGWVIAARLVAATLLYFGASRLLGEAIKERE